MAVGLALKVRRSSRPTSVTPLMFHAGADGERSGSAVTAHRPVAPVRRRVAPRHGHRDRGGLVASDTVSTFILRRLREWGVNRVFAYPGDGSNGLDLAFAEVPELEFVQTRHEEIASFAASAHAKLTGEVGVCMATSGPGAIHLLNGLYDAKLDHAPVVAIVGQQARMSLGASYQQEVDLDALYTDVAHEFVEVCMDPRQAAHLVDRAVRIALSQRTVTAIIVPTDVQDMPYEEPPRAHGAVHSSPGWTRPHVVPT